jgi:hypothetical protein
LFYLTFSREPDWRDERLQRAQEKDLSGRRTQAVWSEAKK